MRRRSLRRLARRVCGSLRRRSLRRRSLCKLTGSSNNAKARVRRRDHQTISYRHMRLLSDGLLERLWDCVACDDTDGLHPFWIRMATFPRPHRPRHRLVIYTTLCRTRVHTRRPATPHRQPQTLFHICLIDTKLPFRCVWPRGTYLECDGAAFSSCAVDPWLCRSASIRGSGDKPVPPSHSG